VPGCATLHEAPRLHSQPRLPRLLPSRRRPRTAAASPYPHPPEDPTFAPPPSRRRVPVPASPRVHVPDPRRPASPSPRHPRTLVLASASRASLRLRPRSPIRPPIPALQRSRIAVSTPVTPPPPTAASRRPRPRAHVTELRGDITAATAVKWPGCGPRRTRPCARSSPGRALEWSIRTITVALQALDPVREEERGRVSWRRRVLRSASDLGVENGRGTESRRYPSSAHARKPAQRNSIGQGVGSTFRARWGHSCSGAGAKAVGADGNAWSMAEI
jgi:hypothetical protein